MDTKSRGGGGTPHIKWRGDARRLTQGYKFRILVSLRVFQAKRHHIQPRRSRIGLHVKKYKNIYIVCVLTWSLLGVKKSLGHAQIGLLEGFNSKFPTSIPTSHMRSPPPGDEIYIVETKRFLTMVDLLNRPFHGIVNFSHHGTSQGKSVDTIGKSALKLVKVPNLKVINDLTL